MVTEENPSGYSFNPRDAFASWSQKELEATGMTFDPAELARIKLSVDKLKGLTLRPFGESGRNKYTTAKALGLPNFDFKDAPKLIQDKEATILEQSLKTGFKVESKDGSTATFNQTLLDHWNNTKSDPNAKINRIPFLESFKDTIKNPDERWDNEGQRVYVKKFINEGGKPRVSVVFVKNNGEVHSAYISDDVEARRGGLSYEKF